ncbi:Uncharacterised protein [uncultured archaeon]|nr:Uncharacterised protein [uncultured archaeon]
MASKRGIETETGEVRAALASSDLTVKEILDILRSEKDAQAFDADAVAGPDHIRLAFFHADKAFEERRNLVRDRMLEVLLRAAAARQVADAVKRIGIKDPKRIVIGFKGDAKRGDSLLKRLKARRMKWGPVDKKAENRMIEKMVLLQLE